MLKGKVAFITGASAGIGAAVARSLSAEGVKLGLASRRGSDLGLDEAVGLTCDVRDFGAVEAAVDETADRFGGLEGLEGMMTADDVAEVVLFVLTRPRGMRILESAFRPMKEASWG